jgi:hypothetical protein
MAKLSEIPNLIPNKGEYDTWDFPIQKLIEEIGNRSIELDRIETEAIINKALADRITLKEKWAKSRGVKGKNIQRIPTMPECIYKSLNASLGSLIRVKETE